jgi:hypothetical protein
MISCQCIAFQVGELDEKELIGMLQNRLGDDASLPSVELMTFLVQVAAAKVLVL